MKRFLNEKRIHTVLKLFIACLITCLLYTSIILSKPKNSIFSFKLQSKLLLVICTDKSSEERAIQFNDYYYEKQMNETTNVIGPIYLYSNKLSPEFTKESCPLYQEMETFPMNELKIRPFIDDLLIKTICLFDYFINKTDAEWLFRPTDDIFLNHKDWPYKLINLLDEKFPHPRKIPYLIGDCYLDNNDKRPLVHGGSGQLFSRKAAELFYSMRYDLLRTRENRWEDFHFPQHAEKFGVTSFSIPNIMASSFLKSDYDKIMNKQFKSIETCDKRYTPDIDTGCVKGMQQLNQLLVMHQYWTKTESMIYQMDQIINESPDYIKWFHISNGSMICRDQ